MNDYTAAVIRLSDAYESMQLARKRVAEEIKSKHRTLARKEIEAATQDLEIEFANVLALETERGIPGSVVREEVLHSQDWSRWKKWRDLAGLETERSIRQNAKAERDAQKELLKRGFEWNSDHSVLTIYRLPDRDIPAPLVISDYRVNAHKWSVGWPMDLYRALRGEKYGHLYMPLVKYLESIFMGAFKSGEIAEREVSRDLEVIEANEARMRADNIYYLENQ